MGISQQILVRKYRESPMSQQSDIEDYQPDKCNSGSQEESFQHYRRRVEKYDQNSIEGKWTDEESLQYVLFMDYYSKIFSSKEKRKTTRIFKTLSKFLVTRTPRQCRSHFQKIMSKFKTLKKVKTFYQEELGLLVYQQKFDSVAKRIRAELPRTEDSEDKEISTIKSIAIQTDPLIVRLSDLPHSELKKLTQIVQEQQKAQMAYWMMPPYPHLGMCPYPPRFQ